MRRDGHVRIVAAEQMVPGDIALLEAGDAISADIRLVEANNLAADELTLTGEAFAVDKATQPVATDTPLADRASMLFKGTTLTRGSGIGVVVATGLRQSSAAYRISWRKPNPEARLWKKNWRGSPAS